MFGLIVRHIRSNIVGYLALFLALGGTAYALERNSVESKHIVNGQVKEADLASNAVSNSIALVSGNVDLGSGDGGQANPVDYPLSNADFSSGPNEAVGYAAEVVMQIPSTCTGSFPAGYVDIFDGDDLIGRALVTWTPQKANLTVTERPGDFFSLYSASTQHSLRAEAYDLCEDGSDFTVKSVKVMAIGVR